MPITSSCVKVVVFLPDPPQEGRGLEQTRLLIVEDCLFVIGTTTSCEAEALEMNLFVVAPTDSWPQLFLRILPDSVCTSVTATNAEFDLVALRSEADSVVLAFPEVDTSLVYRY